MEFQRVVYVLHNHLIGPHKSFENFCGSKIFQKTHRCVLPFSNSNFFFHHSGLPKMLVSM